MVGEPGRKHVAVLAPEGGELGEKPLEVEAAVRVDEALRVHVDAVLDARPEHAHDDLAVDRVCDSKRTRRRDQPEVAHVRDVVVVGVTAGERALDERLHHPPHARLAEACDQRVEVRRPCQDEPFLGLFHGLRGDRSRRYHGHLLDHLAGERVHQPRLALGQLEGEVEGRGRERLSGLLGVLAVEGADLLGVEVAEAERFHLDVERAGRAEAVRVAAARHLVVAHVAKPAEHDRPGGATRPLGVGGP
jgi:hypothetical protein